MLDFASAKVRRVTFVQAFGEFDGWSRDGAYLYFTNLGQSVGFKGEVFRVPAGGGTPMRVVGETYVDTTTGVPSPDGSTIAYTTEGFAVSQWWRRGHAHIDESRIALYTPANGTYRALSPGDAVETWAMWNADGRDVYFVSDRTGAPNLTVEPVAGGAPRTLTHFTNGRVLWPSIATNGSTIAFERDFGIWTYDTSSGTAQRVPIALRGAASQPSLQHLTLTQGITNLALSPDGKKVAFTVRGRIFAASSKDGVDAFAVTTDVSNSDEPVWSPDSSKLAYISDRAGGDAIYLYDFKSGETTKLTDGAAFDYAPRFAPDGKSVAYLHARNEVRSVDLATHTPHTLARGELADTPPYDDPGALTFSPDGAYLAYEALDARGFAHVEAVAAQGGPPAQIDYLANGNLASIVWHPDGTQLSFVTQQRTEDGQIATVDLIDRAPPFREDLFRKLFESDPTTRGPRSGDPRGEPSPAPPESPSAPPSPAVAPTAASASAKPSAAPKTKVRIDVRGISERTQLQPVGVDVAGEFAVTPDGKTLIFDAVVGGQTNIYSYSIDELANAPAVARQLTATSTPKRSLQITPDGKSAYYLDGGRVFAVPIDGSVAARPLPLAASLDADFEREKLETFDQAWGVLNEHYADSNFNGVDWRAVHDTYLPYVRGAHNQGELVRLLNLMVGELDSSHSGVRAAPSPNAAPDIESSIGIDFDRAAYDATGTLRVSAVVPLGPAALTHRIEVGDVIERVDGVPLARDDSFDRLLENRAGKRTVLRVNGHDVPVQPRPQFEIGALRYRAWVASRRELVDRVSGGRLGYVHMQDMGASSLQQLYLDLDTTEQGKAGVIIDIRNNNGGFIDPYALDVFARKNYIAFHERGRPGRLPERASLGQRLLDKPTILITNEHSLSDAENFTEDYRRAKLGKVVGVPTAGWIIFTNSARTIDGTTVRVPLDQTLTLDGVNMELHPRPVDITVEHVLGEDAQGHDAQLEAAVRELLKSTGK